MKRPVSRVSRVSALAVALLAVSGAREQCIPGPFEYDDNGQFTNGSGCSGGFGNDAPPQGFDVGPECFDPFSGCDFECVNDDECRNFFGPDARCESGACASNQPCPLGQEGQFCQSTAESCAFDPTRSNPFDEGTCRPRAASAAPPGAACSIADASVNPCAGSAFCLPIDGDDGLCVEGCQGGGGGGEECGAGFKCSSPFLGGGGRPLCMPACNLDSPACDGARFVCTQAQFEGSCTPDNGACTLAGCDFDGCDPLCPGGQVECTPGTFCLETVVGNCRVEGPDQVFSACVPPALENQPCLLAAPGSCQAGLSCVPSGFSGGGDGRCVQQSSAPAADGEACDPSGSFELNRCQEGSYCALTVGGPDGGVCLRLCNGDAGCPGQACVGANVGTGDGVSGARVCADGCANDADCSGGLRCDVDGGAPCSGPGFCVPPENGGGGFFCVDDADCDSVQPGVGLVCSGDSRCAFPEDACSAQSCILTDPGACAPGFACSPFGTDVPRCVPQEGVSPDGGGCAVSASVSQCEQGSICAGNVCLRLCDELADCAGTQQCVRGNVVDQPQDPADPFRLFDVTVCADSCTASTGCAQLSCDVDGDQSCGAGGGFCLPFESSPFSCSNDADCDSSLPGTVCNVNFGQCVPVEDRCVP